LGIVGARERGAEPPVESRKKPIDELPRRGIKTIWNSWVSDPKNLHHLSMDAKRVWGVLEWCGVEEKPRAVAEALQIHPKDAEELLVGVLFDEHPAMKRMRHYGLPRSHSAVLPDETTLRCIKCGSRMGEVPCMSCTHERTELTAATDQPSLPECDSPIEYLPGTPEKIQVMAKRAEAGFSVFHTGDAQGKKNV